MEGRALEGFCHYTSPEKLGDAPKHFKGGNTKVVMARFSHKRGTGREL